MKFIKSALQDPLFFIALVAIVLFGSLALSLKKDRNNTVYESGVVTSAYKSVLMVDIKDSSVDAPTKRSFNRTVLVDATNTFKKGDEVMIRYHNGSITEVTHSPTE